MNALVIFGAALVPLVIGFIWYHPKVFGTAWMKASGIDPNTGAKPNMLVVFALSYLFSLMLAFFMPTMVIHQMHFSSLMANEADVNVEGSAAFNTMKDFMTTYGDRFRTFKHGALHGAIAAIFFVLPVIGINGLFERRSGKYIFIHVGYFFVTLALVGGIVCQFMKM